MAKATQPLSQLSERSKLFSIDFLIVTGSEKPSSTTSTCSTMAAIEQPCGKQEMCKYAPSSCYKPVDQIDTPPGVLTLSPQLPAPSPIYPMQAPLPSSAPDSPNKIHESDPRQQETADVPNTDVPTHSLDSDKATPQEPSQTDDFKQREGVALADQAGGCNDLKETPTKVVHKPNTIQNNNHLGYVNVNKSMWKELTLPTHASDNVTVDSLKPRANCQQEESFTQKLPNCGGILQPTDTTTISQSNTSICKSVSTTNGYVLNVPQVNLHLTTAHSTQKDLLANKRFISKLDLAAKQRRARRELRSLKSRKIVSVERKHNSPTKMSLEYGVKIYGYTSESCSSDEMSSDVESDMELDLWIHTEPSIKLDLSAKKTGFLNIFELTTHQHKSDIELKKMERRKWLPTLHLSKDKVEECRTDILDLPVPFESPSLLNRSVDYHQKARFLQGIGLQNVTSPQRQELEKNWIKVVNQRIKRKALSSLSNFYQRFGEKILSLKEKDDVILSIPKFCDSSMQTELPAAVIALPPRNPSSFHGLTDCSNTNVTNVLHTIPHATLYSKHQTSSLAGGFVTVNEIQNAVVLKQPVYKEVHSSGTLMHGIVPPEMNTEAKMTSARQTFDQSEPVTTCITSTTTSSAEAYSALDSITNVTETITPATEMTIITTDVRDISPTRLEQSQQSVEGKEREFQISSAELRELRQEKLKEHQTMYSVHDWSICPGVNDMMMMYQKYSKGRKQEIESLEKKCETQRQVVEIRQAEVKRYETRQTELRKFSTTINLKRHNMEKAIDRLTKILQDFGAADLSTR